MRPVTIRHNYPDSVWEHFSNGQRIPMREPLRIDFTEGGNAIEMRVFSRTLSGAELEGFIDDHHRESTLPSVPILIPTLRSGA